MQELSSILIIVAVAVFLLKEGWSIIREGKQNKEVNTESELKENTKSINALNITLTKLEGRMGSIEKKIDEWGIPKMQKDLNRLWGRLKLEQSKPGEEDF